MKIGIITVLYNSKKVIKDFLDSLNTQTFKNFEVFFVENEVGSLECYEYIKEQAKFAYKIVINDKNVGVAKGNNQGINYFMDDSKCAFLMFLNNDVIFDEDFLKSNIDTMVNNKIYCLAPKIFYYPNVQKVWYAGGCLSYWKNGPRHFGHNKKETFSNNGLHAVDYAPTCSLVLRKEVFQDKKLWMWEQLFVYYDDYVFCYLLRKNKIKIWYAPKIFLYHKISSSTGEGSDFSKYYMVRNWAYVARKLKNINFLILPIIYLFNIIRGARIQNKAIFDSLKMN